MKSVFRPVFLLLAVVFLCSTAAHAQVSSPAAEETSATLDEQTPAAANTTGLRRRIDDDVAALHRYEKQLVHASGEDSLVLRRQIAKHQLSVVETLHQLVDFLVKSEKKNPQPELRRDVERTFTRVTPLLRPYVDTLRREIDELRARRPSTPVKDRLQLEDEIESRTEFLDKVYLLYSEHLLKGQALGLDMSEEIRRFKESLQTRADELSGRLDLAIARGNELSLRHKADPSNSDTPILIIATKRSADTNIESLQNTIDLMEKWKLPNKVYRTQLVATTHDISSGIFNVNVAGNLFSRWMKSITTWFSHNGAKIAVKILLFAIILLASRMLAQVVRRGLDRALRSSKVRITELLRRMIVNTTYNILMLIGTLIALAQFGISLGPIMAGLGVAGFIIGFALQDTLANFASGMMILFYRPYDVGDVVEIAGVFGKVDKMSLVSTSILTFDHQTIVVPNNKIWGDVIKNVTDQKIRRVDLVFGISYSDDIEKAEKVLAEILQQHEKVLDNPAPMVRLHELNDSSVDFVVRPWVKTDDYWDVYWDITRAVKLRFDEEGISIPFPQQDVHLYGEPPTDPGDRS